MSLPSTVEEWRQLIAVDSLGHQYDSIGQFSYTGKVVVDGPEVIHTEFLSYRVTIYPDAREKICQFRIRNLEARASEALSTRVGNVLFGTIAGNVTRAVSVARHVNYLNVGGLELFVFNARVRYVNIF